MLDSNRLPLPTSKLLPLVAPLALLEELLVVL
jgi:hypothetical protein